MRMRPPDTWAAMLKRMMTAMTATIAPNASAKGMTKFIGEAWKSFEFQWLGFNVTGATGGAVSTITLALLVWFAR